MTSTRTHAPATADYFHSGRTHPAALLLIVGSALDSGLFYETDVRGRCLDRFHAALPCVDVCLTVDGDRNWVSVPDDRAAALAQYKQIEDAIKASPRGTWCLLRRDWTRDRDNVSSWSAMISDGFGEAFHVQPVRDEPSHALCVSQMLAMDIYRTRCAEEERRKSQWSREVIGGRGWAPGTVLRNVRRGGNCYSTVRVVSITDSGYLKLEMTKRGSRKRWSDHCLAQDLAFVLGPGPSTEARNAAATEPLAVVA